MPITQVDAAGGRGLCALALEVFAPALVIEMEACGLAADVLLFARIAEVYSDRYGSPPGHYSVRRLRTVVRSLGRRAEGRPERARNSGPCPQPQSRGAS